MIVDDVSGDDWAKVELFRHQYGELPKADDERKVDVVRATHAMAQAVYKGQVSTMNAAEVIEYLGREIDHLETVRNSLLRDVRELEKSGRLKDDCDFNR